jgi:hypothetical protein
MDRRIWKPDDGYTRGIVREIRDCCVVVRGREDVDCERSGAIEARVVVGGVGKWHGMAGREDRVADDRGGRRGGGDGKRRGADEQDDGRGGDDDGGDADNDDDDCDGPGNRCALYIYGVYI